MRDNEENIWDLDQPFYNGPAPFARSLDTSAIRATKTLAFDAPFFAVKNRATFEELVSGLRDLHFTNVEIGLDKRGQTLVRLTNPAKIPPRIATIVVIEKALETSIMQEVEKRKIT